MGTLVYSTITSLDGYVADANGNFGWAAPDDEVHAFVNDLERPIGTYLYGRRMYDVMAVWETMSIAEGPMRDFAQLWRAAEKVVYSRTLETPSSARTRIERALDPDAIQRMKSSGEHPLSVGGPGLAAQMLRAGLVDEYQLLIAPVVVGGGTAALPDDLSLGLELLDQRDFQSGFVHLRYRLRGGADAAQ